MMARGSEFQTIQRTRLIDDSGPLAEAVVTFAFKSEEMANVH